MLPEITREEFSAALDRVAEETLDAAGVNRPPVDALALARAVGLTVVLDQRQRGRARYVRLGGARGRCFQAAILLRPEPRRERRQWAVAHEIGEHLAHCVFLALGADPRETTARAREEVACQLAGRLLLPGRWFAEDARNCAWDLPAIKAGYATASHELIARRMLDLAWPVVITVFDQGHLSWRRSNVPGRVPPLCPAERDCRQAAHEENLPQEAFNALSRIQAWPVHEDGWKREILRTELRLEGVDY